MSRATDASASDRPPESTHGNLGARAVGLVADNVIGSALLFVTILAVAGPGVAIGGVLGGLLVLVGTLAGVAAPVAYVVYYESRHGATIGMQMVDLEVVDEHGDNPSTWQSVIRWLLLAVDSLPFFYLLGALLIYVTEDN